MTPLVLAAALFAPGQPAAPAKDLDGIYDLKEMRENGTVTPNDVKNTYQEVTIANGELVLRGTSGNDTAKFTLDPAAKVPQIDFTSPHAGDATVALGIYKVEKDVVTIVFRRGGARPADFNATGKDLVKLTLAKRVAKPAVPPKVEPPKK